MMETWGAAGAGLAHLSEEEVVKKRRRRRATRQRKRMAAMASITAVALGLMALAIWSRTATGSQGDAVPVRRAALSPEAAAGEISFNLNCAECHGENAAGTAQGPPLIHDIYNPGHHSDESFYLAAATGVRQHHWSFGDMPAQPQVSREEAARIIRYIRELQEANGIVYRAHGM